MMVRAETNWANKHQCPGGISELAPSAQYSTIYTTIIFLSVSCPMVPSSINSVFWFTVLGTDRLIGLQHDGRIHRELLQLRRRDNTDYFLIDSLVIGHS